MKRNIFIIILTAFVMAFSYVIIQLFVPVQAGNKYIEIEIPKGTSFRQTVNLLKKERLIRDKNIFLAMGKMTGIDTKIIAGYYSIWGAMSPFDIFGILRHGQIIEYEMTILEGDSIFEIAEKLAKAGIMPAKDFIKLSKDSDFLASYNINAQSIEGYIFPDTYQIPKGIAPETAIGSMIDRMREKYSGKLFRRTIELGMTEHEVLTLASIIEKEAVVDSERPLISAVYHNRLRKKMLLQADPTVIYGIKSSREKITRNDLLRKTPYNTYIQKGLPPGPIASPGFKSITAALYPADVPYLFFVSKDDSTHYFSSTGKEHLEAVRLYREKRLEQKNSPQIEARTNESS